MKADVGDTDETKRIFERKKPKNELKHS